MKNLEQIREEVNKIADALGKPIDKGIRELVIGLRYCGIETSASCEGRIDRGKPYPWVEVPYRFARKLATVVAWQNRPNLSVDVENTNFWVIRPGAGLYLIPPGHKSSSGGNAKKSKGVWAFSARSF